MPFVDSHLKIMLSPFGSPANALSLLSVRTQKLTDKETGVKFHAMANLVSQIISLYQPNKDKVTVVASMMLSITCKPANLVILFINNLYFYIVLLIFFLKLYLETFSEGFGGCWCSP
jgi:hypothetical protein